MDDKIDRRRIVTTLAPLAAVFPNWKPTELTYEVYARVLDHLTPQMLEQAVLSLLSDDREFMPTPGAIFHKAYQIQLIVDERKTVYEGWEQILQSFKGGSEPHPLVVQAADQIGGIRSIGLSTNVHAERARFVEAYRELLESIDRWETLLPQVKDYITANRAVQLPTVEPRRIATDD